MKGAFLSCLLSCLMSLEDACPVLSQGGLLSAGSPCIFPKLASCHMMVGQVRLPPVGHPDKRMPCDMHQFVKGQADFHLTDQADCHPQLLVGLKQLQLGCRWLMAFFCQVTSSAALHPIPSPAKLHTHQMAGDDRLAFSKLDQLLSHPDLVEILVVNGLRQG